MKMSVIFLVVFGLIAAVCAAVLVQMVVRRPSAAVKVEVNPEVKVLTAASALPTMTVVDASAIVTKTVRKSELQPGAMTNSVQVVGKVLTRPMVEGEPFTPACFASEGLGLYLAAALPAGKRAVSISLRDHSGMAGILYPGSVVDVLVSLQGASGKNGTEAVATTLLQGIQVMAVGNQTVTSDQEFKDKNPGAMATKGQINFRMVTLLVTPKQAEILQLATQYGMVSLTMRNPLDSKPVTQNLTRVSEFTSGGRDLGYQVASWVSNLMKNRPVAPAVAPVAPTPQVAVGPDDPFAPTTQPVAAETNPLWEMLVVRGSNSEKRSFPMSEVNQEPGGAKAEPRPEAQPAGSVQRALPSSKG